MIWGWAYNILSILLTVCPWLLWFQCSWLDWLDIMQNGLLWSEDGHIIYCPFYLQSVPKNGLLWSEDGHIIYCPFYLQSVPKNGLLWSEDGHIIYCPFYLQSVPSIPSVFMTGLTWYYAEWFAMIWGWAYNIRFSGVKISSPEQSLGRAIVLPPALALASALALAKC